MEILASFSPTTKYRIVGGNTGTGVFKHDEESYDAFVDINHVVELKQQSQEPMVLGANVSITDAIHFFGAAGEDLDKDQSLSLSTACCQEKASLCSLRSATT